MTAARRKRPVIAIDGPAGSGKSSVSSLLAQRLGLDYVDTGAMYRAVALAMRDEGVDIGDDEAVRRFCSGALIEYSATDGSISVNGRPYSGKIRTEEAAALASTASQKDPVRGLLVNYQRTLGNRGGVVMEGRDIGTVVFPDADIKFFIDASPEIRAGRREKELQARGMNGPLVSKGMAERDRRDASRTNSPLKKAEDAIYIDTSSIGIDAVVEAMFQMVRRGSMLEIFVAKSSGFCFGVKRAINMAEQCGATTDGEICTIGPLIHNPQVVKNLEDAGIRAKSEISEIRSGTVIIRSHGIRRDEYSGLKEKGLNIVDATCPFVKKAQDLVSMLAEEGYSVIVAGEKKHPEVKGLISYGRGDITVAESPEELKAMARKKKIGIIAQTTLPVEKLQAIVAFCLTRASEIKVFNTICNATSVRQEESAELARKVDLMIVVGGRNSANTRRLADICRELQPRTHLVEVAAEIDAAWLRSVRSVGVTSGASTPEWIIREVVERIAESSMK